MVRTGRSEGNSSGQQPADQHLIDQIRAGDTNAYTDIVKTYGPRLQAYVQAHLRDTDRSIDVVQDVFLQLWERRERLDIRTTLQGYLFGSARNHMLLVLRRSRLEEQYETDFLLRDVHPGLGVPVPAPDTWIERRELAITLHRALGQLPARVRQVALLRWRDKLSRAEIASMLGISVAKVHNQLTLATRILRPLLSKHRSDIQK